MRILSQSWLVNKVGDLQTWKNSFNAQQCHSTHKACISWRLATASGIGPVKLLSEMALKKEIHPDQSTMVPWCRVISSFFPWNDQMNIFSSTKSVDSMWRYKESCAILLLNKYENEDRTIFGWDLHGYEIWWKVAGEIPTQFVLAQVPANGWYIQLRSFP